MTGRSVRQHIRDYVRRFQFFFILDFMDIAFDLDRLEYIGVDPSPNLRKFKIVNIEASNIGYQQPDTAHLPEIE